MSLAALLHTPVVLQDMDENYQLVGGPINTMGYFHPQSQQENLVEQETYTTTYLLFLLPGTGVTARHQAVIAGKTLQIKSVLDWYHPKTLVLHHTECVCVEVTG